MSNAARLDFIVSLMDRVSGPANKMMKTMDTVTSNIQTGYQKIGYGVAGLFSVGYAFDKMLAPAKEMRTALGTISSLGVENSALEHLRKTSMATAVQYGSDATEIVNASYKLQSAISGLKGNELSMLANKSAMLATATKGGLESTNAYVGQMFNIHAVEADAIGKTAFMDKLISKTAKAVQLFNTDGTQMGEAMKNIGKQATAMKVPLEEQLAVMGFLQNTMVEGGRSGNAYSSFLANISKAETTLGMKFTDSQNKALPMVDIITKLQGKFGDLSKAGDQQMLQKAFGKRGQQVLAAMAGSLDTFKGNLESIKSVKGLDDVTAMAMAIADPWDQSAAAVKNFRMEFGERLLKVFSPVYDQITLTMTTLTKWMDMFPHLTGAVIKGVIGIGILVGSLSALSIVVGLSKFVMVGWTVVATSVGFIWGTLGKVIKLARLSWLTMNLQVALSGGLMNMLKINMLTTWVTMAAGTIQTTAMTLATGFWSKSMMVASIGSKGLAAGLALMKFGFLSSITAVWAFSAALWANPITWIVVGVIALTAAVVAAVVYWDTWTATLGEWSTAFAEFIGVFDFVDGVLALWNKLPEWWASFKNYLSGMNVFSFVGDSIDWLIDKINMIPGINIDTTTDMPKPVAAPASLSNAAPKMAGGGLMNQISNATSNNNSRNVGDVHINNYGQAMSGQSLMDELAFAAP
ncbi:phage tail tape measure protein [Marinomonas primoryensis]|uniref:Phage tail tape measure protein n=1 Tax=Marinomonas primoryensis TaxID=178399 RepID=A0A2Z4PQT3_9GAMM|nr:phage tail tape measure protein [Marinomonas primoryensis]AWX99508.1 phage tail tape measure protein [Marinomonas primoryensis]